MPSTLIFRATAAVLAGLATGLAVAQHVQSPDGVPAAGRSKAEANERVAALSTAGKTAPPQFAPSASATLVAHVPGEAATKREALAEPSTLVVLLAGAVVVVFVAARRRSSDR